MTLQSETTSVYSLYHAINIRIGRLESRIRENTKRLEYLARGHGEVKAQTYDQLPTARQYREITERDYEEIRGLAQRNRKLTYRKRQFEAKKLDLEETIRLVAEVAMKERRSIEMMIFEQHHVKKVPLKELAHTLHYTDYFGRERPYDYGYIRNVNAMIEKKMHKCDNLL